MRRRIATPLLGFIIALTGSVGLAQSSSLRSAEAVGGRFCSSSDFGFSKISIMQTYLNNQYGPPSSKKVWQSLSDNSVWLTWCKVTSGDGRLDTNTGVATPSAVELEDGTRVELHTMSKSGGFTVEINAAGG